MIIKVSFRAYIFIRSDRQADRQPCQTDRGQTDRPTDEQTRKG